MNRKWTSVSLMIAFSLAGATGTAAQSPDDIPAADVISRSIKSVGYEVGGGSTKVIFLGTNAASSASGEAKVEAKKGKTDIEAKFTGLPQANTLGTELLTYVLWAITPDGRSNNLGEILIDKNSEGALNATTQLSTFALIVTAEPYFAVRIPSEFVVLENDTKKNTKGKIFPDNSYKLMARGQYEKMDNPLALTPDLKNYPLSVYEARNAVDIAKSRQARKYAPAIYDKAQGSLKMMENAVAAKENKKQINTLARQTVQFAEDARALSAQRQDAEQVESEKKAAADRAAGAAKAEADQRAAIEAHRQAELSAAKEAQMKAEADAAAMRSQADAARAKAAADEDAAKAKAEADALKAKEETANAEALRAQREAAALRAQLLEQFNRVLETTDTPRGLVVNMADVLFAFGKYNLQNDAQVKLAKLSGIILAHPGLHLAVEGYTDNIGGDEPNMKLSEQRANTVRNFLIQQGLTADSVTAVGLGKTSPVADNSTAAGRQKNRRVEIIVSGEIIGQQIGK